ncbi:MAG: adenylate/guanylate cyclase domain-containing protein [Pseudomonadota bacterium]
MGETLRRIYNFNPLLISLTLAGILIGVYITGPRFLEVVELKALDVRFLLRGPIRPGPEVVIAAIDEKSVDRVGRWPWPRDVIANMVRNLAAGGAKAVAFDIGFFEVDANTNLSLIQRLLDEISRSSGANRALEDLLVREKEKADYDLALSRAIGEVGDRVVLGYFFHMNRDDSVAHISPEELERKIEGVREGRYPFVRLTSREVELKTAHFSRAFMPEANIPLLSDVARFCGFFNMFPDPDGTVRWVPMAIACRDQYYMPLSLQALRASLDQASSALNVSQVGVEAVSVGPFNLPTDEMGRLLVNYRGPGRTFPHYSIVDILDGNLPAATFRDKIVLVGATAVGIYDMRVTPFDSLFPGVEIHANVIDNILHRDFLVRPNWTAVFDLALILLTALILGLLLPRASAVTAPVLGMGLAAAIVGTNYLLFVHGLWANIVYPVTTLILVYTSITIFRYVTEEREKKKIRGAFSYYVNPSVVTEMLKNPEMLKLGGDKRIMTVLFSDIRGFTTISENMDPESLVHLLNQYLTAMTSIVFKFDGLVDKYIGDAIMAVWGAPLSQPKHASLACRASLEMMHELENLRKTWALEDPGLPFIDIGIGLNSGPMVVGNMGSDTRFDYTVMGDSVNLGSRLEGANKQYGTNIIIGEMTFEQVKEELICRELDAVAVKGKARPVRIFELLGEPGKVPRDKILMVRAFSRGIMAYKNRRWDEAMKIFSAINVYYPEDNPTELYLERTAELKLNPPAPDWDGVFVMKTK